MCVNLRMVKAKIPYLGQNISRKLNVNNEKSNNLIFNSV